MKKVNERKIGITAIIVTISIAIIIITIGFVGKSQKSEPETWILHSYGNNVALYKNKEIVEVFGAIMLDTLPDEDKRLLDNGIAFPNKEEALNAIEDYDG